MKRLIHCGSLNLCLLLILAFFACSEDRSREPTSETRSKQAARLPEPAQATPTEPVTASRSPSPGPKQRDTFGSIEGSVTNPDGGPIVGCAVIFVPLQGPAFQEFMRRGRYRESEPLTVTDASGYFIAETIPVGTYMLAFRAPGFAYHEDYSDPVEVRAGETVSGIMQRLQPGGTIAGQVVENLTAEAIPAVRVMAQPVSVSFRIQAREGLATLTDASGEFRLDVLRPAERYDLTATHDRYVSATLESVMTDTGEPVRIVMSPGGRVEGRVVSSVDGSPIPGATVQALAGKEVAREVRSASDGEYLMHGLEPGRYRLEAEKDGASSERLPEYELEVTLLGHHRVNLTLTPPGVIELFIIDTETKEPIEGAEVEFSGREDRYYSNEKGIVRSGGFRKGQVQCKVTHIEYFLVDEYQEPGFHGWESYVRPGWFGKTIPIHPGEISSSTVEMRQVSLTDLTGIVVDEKDSPVALVEVRAKGHVKEFVSYSESDGAFGFNDIPEGGYGLTVRKENFAPIIKHVRIDDGKPEPLRLVLREGASIEGVVVDEEGNPLKDFTVWAVRGSLKPWDASARFEGSAPSDADSHWRMDHLSEGDYRISASKGLRRSEKTGEIHVGWTDHIQGIRLVVPDLYSVSGKVVDWKDQHGLAGVGVRIHRSSTRTDESGEFILKGIPPRSHSLNLEALPRGYVPTIGVKRGMPVEVVDRDVTGLVIELRKGAIVRGQVLSPTSEPAAGAEVLIMKRHADMRREHSVKSGTRGRFEFPGVEPAKGYHMIATMNGQAPAMSDDFDLAEGEVKEGFVLRFPVPGKVSGTVKDASGNPPVEEYRISSAFVDVRNFWRTLDWTELDKSGRYLIEPLPPGPVKVQLLGEAAPDWRFNWGGGGGKSWSARQQKVVEVVSGEELTGVDFIVPVKVVKQEEKKEPKEPNAFITGRVVDSKGEGIPGVEVSASIMTSAKGEGCEGKTTTAWDGSFRIDDLIPGKFSLTAIAGDANYNRPRLRDITAPIEGVEIILRKLGSIEGRVVVGQTGVPVRRYFLRYGRLRNTGAREFIDDPKGRFRIDGLMPDSYTIVVEEANLGLGEKKVTVGYDEEVRDLVIEIDRCFIEGRVVRDDTGAPIRGAKIAPHSLLDKRSFIASSPLSDLGRAITNADGRFSVMVDKPGTEILIVEHPDYGNYQFPGIRPPSENVVLRLKETGRMCGHAYHASGEPFRDSGIEVNSFPLPSGYELTRKTRTDYEGYYEFPRLAPGLYSAKWRRAFEDNTWSGDWAWQVEVRPGETTVLDLIEKGTKVNGTLTRGDEPVPHVWIVFSSAGDSRPTWVYKKGDFRIGGLRPGTYDLIISKTIPGETLHRQMVDIPDQDEVDLHLNLPAEE